MSSAPSTWDNCITEAEEQCFDYLCDILGLRSGLNAFIGVNSGATDCVVFDIGAPQTGDQYGYASQVFHYHGQLDIYSRSRKQVQYTVARLMQKMPVGKCQGVSESIGENTIVENFRIAPQTQAVAPISTTELTFASNAKGIPVFTTSVIFDIVFNCGDRAA